MKEMKRAVELDPLAPRILDNYSTYLIAAGKSRSFGDLDRALEIQPGSLQAQNFKGIALVKAGRTEEARTNLKHFYSNQSGPSGIRILAETLLATGRRNEAERLLQHPPDSNFYRGLLLCALGRGEEAIPLLKPVVSIYRDIILWTFQDLMPESPRSSTANWRSGA